MTRLLPPRLTLGARFAALPALYRHLWLAILALAMLPAHAAQAATYTVINGNDSGAGSLRQAATQAVSGDIINITYTAASNGQTIQGVIPLGSTVQIASGVTVNAPSVGIQISGLGGAGNGGFSVLEITAGTGTATLNNLTLEDGLSAPHGGELVVDTGASASLKGCTLTGGGAGAGGGIYNQGSLRLYNCTVSGNASTGNGGGIDDAGSLILTDCSISQNGAGNAQNTSSSGGGIYVEAAGNVTASQTLFNADTATLNGGAVEISGATNGTDIQDCVFTGNTATGSGGGVDSQPASGSVSLFSCSFSGNTAANGNGVSCETGTSTFLTNDIIYDAASGTDAYAVAPGTITASYSDIHNLNFTTDGLTNGGNDINAPPGFVSATDLHLVYNAPPLGVGSPSATSPDFDGFGPPASGNPAIGAYEGSPVPLTLTVTSTTDTGLASGSLGFNEADSTTLRAAINYANDYSVVNIGFDTTVFASAQTIALTQGGLTLSKPMTIAASSPGLVTVSGGGPVFTISATGVSLTDLGITGGEPVFSALFGTSGGGGVLVNTGANATLTGCTITGNTNDGSGGGVDNVGTVTLTDCALSGNTAAGTVGINGGEGGGLYNGGTATLNACFIGQSVTNLGGTPTVTGSGNTAPVGGGIYNDTGATLTIRQTVFEGNTASGGGGGLDNVAATTAAQVINCTFVGNQAGTTGANPVSAPGGGVYNGSPGQFGGSSAAALLSLVNCTFTGNSATNGGGAVASYGGATLVNDILYADTDTSGNAQNEDVSVNVSPDTAYHCDIEGGTTNTGLTLGDSANISGNPDFLTAYTTPTAAYDLRLGTGSAAIGAGAASAGGITAPTTDITGATRPTPPSIGAFDVNATNGTGPTANSTGGGGGTTTPAATTTALTSSANPSVSGQAVTFTATVSSASGTPTGTVTFTIDGTAGSPVTLTSGAAADVVSTLSVGNHTVSAAYNGSGSFAASASSSLSQSVGQAATQFALTASANPVAAGSPVTYTAALSATAPGGGTPTGTVQFYMNNSSTPFDTETLANGTATTSPQTYTSGPVNITATYSGDAAFFSNSSPLLTQQVTSGSTTPTATTGESIIVNGGNPAATAGQSVSTVVTVTPTNSAGPTPTGTVSFAVNGGAPVSVNLVAGSGDSATATYTTSSLPTGTDNIVASYSGDGNYVAAPNAVNSVITVSTATPTPTTTNVSSPAAGSSYTTAESLPLVAEVSPSTATGTVTFTLTPLGGTTPAATETGTLSGGTATATVPVGTLAAGIYTVEASYGGDTADAPSASAIFDQIISPATTTPPATLMTFPAGALEMAALDETYTDFAAALNYTGSATVTPPAYDTYNGSAYVLANSATEAAPTPGTGFWIDPNTALNVYDTGTAATGPVTVALNQGWNIIGDPAGGPYPLSLITVTGNGTTANGLAGANQDGLVYGTLYTYGPSSTPTTGYTVIDGTASTASLSAFTGYWLYAFQPGETLTFPLVQARARR